ncbi:hypothetical protein DSAG12_01243 [Promethearchaeum syntrophicum]|uniref:Uncharacterized protein n=1 Tax=Promethearchaeum syntrophicum TaxID=2594042 RepID=A0A5B9D842_9ARCH|nr:hypothetical protein [Candidatus Prometheoarchaeum syntrophicum]QEE15418.1 hypothetical protein DSAG12_01243 [Candidatus Prometheoarchaeum syntrophicum]
MVFDQTKDFFQRYYLQYWITKAESLYYQLNNIKKFSTFFDENEYFKEAESPEKPLQNMITFDLHFLKFQIIEALFSLIFALETSNEEEIWFNLSIPNEISKRNFKLYDRIASFKSKGELFTYLRKENCIQDQQIEFWKVLFFQNENEIQEEKKVFENILRILWSFRNQFKDRGDYNAFKHGLRCMGSSIYLSWAKEEQYGIPPPNFKEKLQPLGYAENVITFFKRNSQII